MVQLVCEACGHHRGADEILRHYREVHPGFGRRWRLVRSEDVTGISGTGIVVQGLELPSGPCVYTWVGERSTTTIARSVEDVQEIHGHGGRTVLEWIDRETAA
jgi:hypothetical protein